MGVNVYVMKQGVPLLHRSLSPAYRPLALKVGICGMLWDASEDEAIVISRAVGPLIRAISQLEELSVERYDLLVSEMSDVSLAKYNSCYSVLDFCRSYLDVALSHPQARAFVDFD